ncbi:hypothetical protein K437DRAFT_128663 [Tilletiaria anomala UBC 951]|uniref:Uncharacterized protein n=1 Tax=Tilletiaria anomala (strain ATCC 24038 / CBS 436.72 / UBC 951) TaxID=1037660 RepID=A0A066W1G9_TILAU|nr:uncharacterized protein K437DRAFT_128663 [Tilletiaria anomala UBC 951]KDN44899.1 hypothetical protein K437DRAFT_128663 [Tilletiaria anomala UBC 951]
MNVIRRQASKSEVNYGARDAVNYMVRISLASQHASCNLSPHMEGVPLHAALHATTVVVRHRWARSDTQCCDGSLMGCDIFLPPRGYISPGTIPNDNARLREMVAKLDVPGILSLIDVVLNQVNRERQVIRGSLRRTHRRASPRRFRNAMRTSTAKTLQDGPGVQAWTVRIRSACAIDSVRQAFCTETLGVAFACLVNSLPILRPIVLCKVESLLIRSGLFIAMKNAGRVSVSRHPHRRRRLPSGRMGDQRAQRRRQRLDIVDGCARILVRTLDIQRRDVALSQRRVHAAGRLYASSMRGALEEIKDLYGTDGPAMDCTQCCGARGEQGRTIRAGSEDIA